MADPADMIVPLLREMRSEIAGQFHGVEGRLDRIDHRLQKLEDAHASYCQALEHRVKELEALK